VAVAFQAGPAAPALARQSAPKLSAASEIVIVAAIAMKLLFTVGAHEGFGERAKMGWSGIISGYFRPMGRV
jgi:hypothetical protein